MCIHIAIRGQYGSRQNHSSYEGNGEHKQLRVPTFPKKPFNLFIWIYETTTKKKRAFPWIMWHCKLSDLPWRKRNAIVGIDDWQPIASMRQTVIRATQGRRWWRLLRLDLSLTHQSQPRGQAWVQSTEPAQAGHTSKCDPTASQETPTKNEVLNM